MYTGKQGQKWRGHINKLDRRDPQTLQYCPMADDLQGISKKKGLDILTDHIV